jgi:hypothetical protein
MNDLLKLSFHVPQVVQLFLPDLVLQFQGIVVLFQLFFVGQLLVVFLQLFILADKAFQLFFFII